MPRSKASPDQLSLLEDNRYFSWQHRQRLSESRSLPMSPGDRFGRLVLVERSPVGAKYSRWRCQCDCGKMTFVAPHDLKSGKQQSCGCLKNEKAAARLRQRKQDLSGKVYGLLTVLEEDVEFGGRNNAFRCQCICGNVKSVLASNLRRGATRSCGCQVKGGRKSR